MSEPRNRLAAEKSPYLLQHAGNPVEWYPWGEEAFARASELERPIFLSIGYSTCHWCHVMERESFEDPEVARLLNEGFVPVKVDREERPDVDALYMMVCQMLTGSGGWPLTVVLTPDRKPFFAGTYFPRTSRYGRPGLLELLPRLRALWEERRGDVRRSSEEITEAVARAARPGEIGEAEAEPGLETMERAVRLLERSFDPHGGGFGGAPRFPTPHQLVFLLRWWSRSGEPKALEMAEVTLRAMRRGGLWDHVGFGFHRYSTDARWLVPHFEKMLYDQALHVLAYAEAWLATGEAAYRRTAEETIAYVLRDLTGEEGAFLSAEDADSEGEEGRFYLWEAAELEELLGGEAELVRRVWSVEEAGNFADEATGDRTGRNILHLRRELPELATEVGISPGELERRLEAARQTLLRARGRRVRPHRDDKVLTDWNGLMIGALAVAARLFGEPAHAAAARGATEFLLSTLRDEGGRLLHRWRDGEAAVPGTAEDHAFLAWGLLQLYETELEPRWLREALGLADELVERFRDPEGGGLFSTAEDAEPLLVRLKESYDGAIPSGNSVAMEVFLRLARITGDPRWEAWAAEIPRAFASVVRAAPTGHAWMLAALDLAIGPSREVVLVGDPAAREVRDLLSVLRGTYAPRTVTLLVPPGERGREVRALAPFVKGFEPPEGQAAAFVCRDHACDLPTADPEELRRKLEAA